jgi:hypothetical protein
MARKRMIDPNFWSDDKIIELEPMQRLLFIGMWNFSDDSGVLKNSPKQLKAQIFPADNITPGKITEWLMNIHGIGLILFNEDKTLIQIKGWSNYQKINRPQPSKYVFKKAISEHSVNVHGTITPNRIEDSVIENSIIEKNRIAQIQIEFDRFYDIYPRKRSKQRALKTFKNLSKKDRTLAMEVLPLHVKDWQSKGTAMEHIPHPSSWLNGKCWEDQLDQAKTISIDTSNADHKRTQKLFNDMREAGKNSASHEDIQKILSPLTKKLSVN